MTLSEVRAKHNLTERNVDEYEYRYKFAHLLARMGMKVFGVTTVESNPFCDPEELVPENTELNED